MLSNLKKKCNAMIKNFVFALCALVFATSMMAQSGKSCDDPIPVDSNYEGVITEPGEYWFTAWTYDLPLNVHFTPNVDNSTTSPEVLVDFTCDPGVYNDPKLNDVINNVSSFGLELPVEFLCAKVERYGKIEWDLSINANYREELTKCGITYNVQAFVKVYFPEAGKISLRPDTTYTSCMDNAIYVNLGDTLDVTANDNVTFYAFPYSEWCKDSIQFVWTGDNAARIWVSDGDCDFTPTSTNVDVRAIYDVTKTTPYKLYEENMDAAIKSWLGGGVFFAKVISKSAGQLIVEKIPMGPIQGGAILLQHDVPVQLAANDSRVFCFPRTWTSTEFVAPTQFVMNMFVSNTSEFTPSVDDANVLNKYAFNLIDGKRVAQLSTADIAKLVATATDDYVYVRFACNQATTLTPKVWTPTSCAEKSILLQNGTVYNVPKGSKTTLYRMCYQDWKGYDINVNWTGRRVLPTYYASICDFSYSSNANGVLNYYSFSKGNTMVNSSVVASWESRLDESGFVYVRFDNNSTAGDITFTSSKPAEEDPVIPSSPCVASSIELKSGDQLTLNLDSAFTVYRIDYKAWLKSGANLIWNGAEPLHTFVAETCAFALAPYNRYVLAYIPVPAQGNIVLDAIQLAAMEEYVSEDGFLYIRFLTKEEGVLEVK